MKTLLAVVLVLVLGSLLWAQSGMFDLGFGMSRDEAHKILLEKGFTVSERDSFYVVYTNAQKPDLSNLTLVFESGVIYEWKITLKVDRDESRIGAIRDELNGLHGDVSYWDELIEEQVWELDNGKAVYMWFSEYLTTMYIVYCESDGYWDWY